MKVIKSRVELVQQEPTFLGMIKHIELTGRVAYQSEHLITDESCKTFVEMIKKRGHWAVLEQGTAYLILPIETDLKKVFPKIKGKKSRGYPFLVAEQDLDNNKLLVTTNYRFLKQSGKSDEWIKENWGYTTNHPLRVSTKWTVSRYIGEQLLRHRTFSFVKESGRYVNLKTKSEGGVNYVVPQWAYRIEPGTVTSPDTFLTGAALWKFLLKIRNKRVERRNKIWQEAEDAYFADIEEGARPEEARGALPMDLRSEMWVTGFLEDFYYVPEPDSPEKVGFFNIRLEKDAQQDLRVLAEDIDKQIKQSLNHDIKQRYKM